jgi:hypothetical protein
MKSAPAANVAEPLGLPSKVSSQPNAAAGQSARRLSPAIQKQTSSRLVPSPVGEGS